jgi:hypothetical protein
MESESDGNKKATGGPRKSVPVLPNEFLEFDSEGEEERVTPSPNDATEWTPPAKKARTLEARPNCFFKELKIDDSLMRTIRSVERNAKSSKAGSAGTATPEPTGSATLTSEGMIPLIKDLLLITTNQAKFISDAQGGVPGPDMRVRASRSPHRLSPPWYPSTVSTKSSDRKTRRCIGMAMTKSKSRKPDWNSLMRSPSRVMR